MTMRVLVAMAAVAVLTAGSAGGPVHLARYGDLADARREAEARLGRAPQDVTALVVLACVAIERGEIQRASDLVERLARSGSPRTSVLRRLVDRRRSHPSERVSDAVVQAWKEAGRPDLASDLEKDDSYAFPPPLDASAIARMSEPERLALSGLPGSLADGERAQREYRLRLVAAAANARANALWVNALLLEGVEQAQGPELQRELATAASLLASAAETADPGNGFYAMLAALAGGPDSSPLTDGELSALEAAVAAPRFAWPARAIQQGARARLREVDPAHGDVRGAILPFSTLPLFTPRFTFRADATCDPAARARAVRALAAAGRRLREAQMLIIRMFGMVLEDHAASISADAGERSEVRARGEELHAFWKKATNALERLGVWPLVSMIREMDPEADVAFMQRLIE